MRKVGKRLWDKEVLTFEQMLNIHDKYQIVISVSERYEKQMAKQLTSAGIDNYLFLKEAYEQIKYKSDLNLQKYQNMYEGKRCFIVGTGPSLKIEDLEALEAQGEITIASNKIFKLFDQTTWRPDIYCVIDNLVIKQYRSVIAKLPVKNILLANIGAEEVDFWKANGSSNIDIFRLIYKPFEGKRYPEFSFSPDRYVIEGFTVTYAIMQWAVYMGFKEMYLLGIDFDYGDKETGYKHFMNRYDNPEEAVNPPRLDKCLKAYEVAEKLSYRNGFRIFNATRGGKLEVFERVNIDDLIKRGRKQGKRDRNEAVYSVWSR